MAATNDALSGGRIDDAHIAEIPRAAKARMAGDRDQQPRHFLAALRHGIRVETPSEFLASRKKAR